MFTTTRPVSNTANSRTAIARLAVPDGEAEKPRRRRRGSGINSDLAGPIRLEGASDEIALTRPEGIVEASHTGEAGGCGEKDVSLRWECEGFFGPSPGAPCGWLAVDQNV